MTIGELIRHTRKEKGMTQKQVAEICGMADSAIRKYESGSQTPKLRTIQRIAAALGVEWTVSVHKLTDAEAYRAGFLQFHSEEDRIVHFYKQLTNEGKLVAGGQFFRHLDKGSLSEVADYVMKLTENPLYQRQKTPQAEQDTPERPQEPSEEDNTNGN